MLKSVQEKLNVTKISTERKKQKHLSFAVFKIIITVILPVLLVNQDRHFLL